MEQQKQQHVCEEHGCFIVIRFPMKLTQTCKNSLTKQMPIHSNYAGRVSGVSPSLEVIEGSGTGDKGIALMYFETTVEAERWYVSVPEIKQQDWLGGVDMVLVPVCERPDPESVRFVQLIDLEFYNFERFQTDYSDNASEVLKKHGAKQIVSTPNSKKLRGLWDPNYLVLNCWGHSDCFQTAYHCEENHQLKQKRQSYACANMCVFELEPLIDRRC